MKTIGLIGGISPESTVVYYKEINRLIIEKTLTEYPRIIINSINMNQMLSYFTTNDYDGLCNYLNEELHKLKNAGADYAVLTSNTPHLIFDKLLAVSPLNLLSIVELALIAAKEKNIKKAALFGTGFTMKNLFYDNIFSAGGIKLFKPDENEQNYIHSIYFGELVKGIIKDETRERLIAIINALKTKYNIEAVILGGTELPLILNSNHCNDVVLLDTTQIHIQGIVDYYFQ